MFILCLCNVVISNVISDGRRCPLKLGQHGFIVDRFLTPQNSVAVNALQPADVLFTSII